MEKPKTLWAHVKNGEVRDIIDFNPAGQLDPSLLWVECGPEIEPRWRYRDGAFLPPPPPGKAEMLERAWKRRLDAEEAGIAVDGIRVATTRDSQTLITGACLHLAAGGQGPVSFKAESGFVILDAARMNNIAFAVRTHVQACFTKEAEIVAKIAAGKITTREEIDAAFAAVANTADPAAGEEPEIEAVEIKRQDPR